MIAPHTAQSAQAERLREQTRAFFAPGGALARETERGDFPYEARPQQVDMAEAVAEALATGQRLAVEAGTGVGKSFAYLVPILLAAAEAEEPVVISTYTISLQEQLLHKDIPFLQKCLGTEHKAVLVKGRSNYLCKRRLARTDLLGPDLFDSERTRELAALRQWADSTDDGTLQDLHLNPAPDVWDQICVEQGNCLWQDCPEFASCFFMRDRRRMQQAQLLVVNHHMLFADLILREQGAGILPPYSRVILDEAHHIEGVASSHLGLRLGQNTLHFWLRRLYAADGKKGILKKLRAGDAALLASKVWEATDRFFGDIRRASGIEPGGREVACPGPLSVPGDLLACMDRLATECQTVADELDDAEIRAELVSLVRRGKALREALDAFLHQKLEDQVYWVEPGGRHGFQLTLCSAPVEVAPHLASRFFDTVESAVLTSATLAAGEQMDYFCQRVGLEEAATLQVGSPFNYDLQMQVLVPRNMPAPAPGPGYAETLARAIQHSLARSRGHAFVLFTNRELMRTVAAPIRTFCDEQGLLLLVQGEGMPRRQMLERFQEEPSSVLFGLDSFWTGVDVRGEALQSVIITRLPFAVPDKPLLRARYDRIKERGGDPFKEYALPEALLKFRQGIGRLIRTASDTGVVTILDPRLHAKWYGRFFLKAIPTRQILEIDLD